MRIEPIKTKADQQGALKRISALMGVSPGTPEIDELDVMATFVERYESQHYTIALPAPIEAIRFRLRKGDLKQRDLEPFIGSPGWVSEILSYKRKLTVAMIRRLHTGLNIPAACLIQDYALKR